MWLMLLIGPFTEFNESMVERARFVLIEFKKNLVDLSPSSVHLTPAIMRSFSFSISSSLYSLERIWLKFAVCCSLRVVRRLYLSNSTLRAVTESLEILFFALTSSTLVLITRFTKSSFWWGFQWLGNSLMALIISFLMLSHAPSNFRSDRNSLG